jgi:hypothetical protein
VIFSYSGTDFTDETGPGYMAKKEEMPVKEEKPGRYWGVIGRQHLPGIFEQEETEVTEIFFSVLCSLCSLLFKLLHHEAIPFGKHAAGEAEVSAQESTVVGRFYGQAVLQC